MNYGEKITELRKSKGMTQTELGEKLNVAFQTISKWERGESVPDLDMMFKISKLFQVPITYFDDSDAEVAAAQTEPGEPAPQMLGVCTECGRVVYEGSAATTYPALVCTDCRDRKIAWNKSVADEAKLKKQKERTAEAKSAKQRLIAGLIVSGVIGVWWLIGAIIVAVEGEPAAEIGASFAGLIFELTFVPQLFWKNTATRALCGLGVSMVSQCNIILLILFGIWLFIPLTVFGCVVAFIIAPFTFVPDLLDVIFTIKNGKSKKKSKAKAKKK